MDVLSFIAQIPWEGDPEICQISKTLDVCWLDKSPNT